MKRQFVIECDTERYSCFVGEVTKDMTPDGCRYFRPWKDKWLFNEIPSPKLYGKLHAIMFAKDTIAKAAPIEPEMPQEPEKAEATA